MFQQFFHDGLHGKNAHADPILALKGLHWRLAGERPTGVPHSVWQLVNHMIFWQDFVLAYLKGEKPSAPQKDKDSWPDDKFPADESEWDGAVLKFTAGLKEAERESDQNLAEIGFGIGQENTNRADLLGTIVTHNSYHIGQVVLIRRLLEVWPPSTES